MRKGVAKCYCVGGAVSCIGAWGVPAPHVLPLFISMALFYSITEQIARSFETVRKGPFFVVQRVAVCGAGDWVARHGWGLGAVRKAGCKAGNKVGFAPWNIPAVGLGGDGKAGSRGIFRRCDPLRGMGFECALSRFFFFTVCFQQANDIGV